MVILIIYPLLPILNWKWPQFIWDLLNNTWKTAFITFNDFAWNEMNICKVNQVTIYTIQPQNNCMRLTEKEFLIFKLLIYQNYS